MKNALATITITCTLISTTLRAEDNTSTIESMQEVFDFIPYSGGNIFVEAIPTEEWENYFIIDTRSKERFEAGHINGATNIEWREVLAKKEQIPRGKPVLLYCDTGSISSQAAFALRVATSREDILILNKGYEAYQTHILKTQIKEDATKVKALPLQ